MFFAIDEFGNETLERFEHENVLQDSRFWRDLNPTFISRRKARRSSLLCGSDSPQRMNMIGCGWKTSRSCMAMLRRSRGALFAPELCFGEEMRERFALRRSSSARERTCRPDLLEEPAVAAGPSRSFRQAKQKTEKKQKKEAERRQTLFNNLRILRCGSAPFGEEQLAHRRSTAVLAKGSHRP